MGTFDVRYSTDGNSLTLVSITEVIPPPPPPPSILAFIGDSNTATRVGNGIFQEHTFSQLVADNRGFDQVINAGVGGQTSAQMLARFQSDILDHNPDHVSIDGGINGVMAGQTAAQYESDIRAMVQMCVDDGVGVSLSTPWLVRATNYIETIDPFLDKVRLVAADFNIPLVDVYAEVEHLAWKTGSGATFLDKYISGDAQHASALGHSFRASLYAKPHNWRACRLA